MTVQRFVHNNSPYYQGYVCEIRTNYCHRRPSLGTNIIASRRNKMRASARSDTNRAVQPQKIARDLKFRFKEVEGLYYVAKTQSR